MSVILFLILLKILSAHCTFSGSANHEDRANEELHEPQEFESVIDQNSDSTILGDLEPFGSQNQGNFFMDVYSVQTGPKQVEFGHVFEDPELWEQRYEKKDHEKNRFQGQVYGKGAEFIIKALEFIDTRYANIPKEDHYEFAFKRGNEHHVKEQFEKAAPHLGHFKTHTKWGDKHGGYGEQYWDYNHGGENHGDSNNDETALDINVADLKNIEESTSKRIMDITAQTFNPNRGSATYSNRYRAEERDASEKTERTYLPPTPDSDFGYKISARKNNNQPDKFGKHNLRSSQLLQANTNTSSNDRQHNLEGTSSVKYKDNNISKRHPQNSK